MNLHSLSPAKGSRRTRKRVGRGRASGMGKTSTAGHKGQMARKGHKVKPTFEGGQMPLVRRMPKRGFKNVNDVDYIPVNIAALGQFTEGAEVTVKELRASGLVRGPSAPVKILGNGEISQKIHVKVQAFSASARAKIEAAGGTCETVK